MAPSKSYLEKLATRWSNPLTQRMFICLFFLIAVLGADWFLSVLLYRHEVLGNGFIKMALAINHPVMKELVVVYGMLPSVIVMAIIWATTFVGTLVYLPSVFLRTMICAFFGLDEDETSFFIRSWCSISSDYSWISDAIFDKRRPFRVLLYLAGWGISNVRKGLFWIIFWPAFVAMKLAKIIGTALGQFAKVFRTMYFSSYNAKY
ncbi:MAG: hypothetical protein PHE24_02775 [Patescibacteria group bacterium]|nr:hypothetical protein [Patescibacteria group bacterium]